MNISSTETLTAAVSTPGVLIAAGGTGGHVYPGVALADALKFLRPDLRLLFAGTRDRMEWQAVPKAGYEIRQVWISGFHRRWTLKNLLFPVKLGVSLLQSYRILQKFRPDVVICCGGFASGPIGWVASKMKISLVLQEQNSFPGVTNRLLAPHADKIYTAFEAAGEHLPKEKIRLTGNPLRSSLTAASREEALTHFGFESSRPTLLVLGGSGGARSINDAMEQNLTDLHDKTGIQIIWQCGKSYYGDLSERISRKRYSRLRLMEYIDHMPEAYSAADLVISRAGALSCSELMLTGKPSILIPSPNVAGDHQTKNAESMTHNGAAHLLNDAEAKEKLGDQVRALIQNEEKLTSMSRAAARLAKPEAAKVIAKEILKLIDPAS